MMIGCVHGRFQVFHLDHLRYVTEAFQRCDHLLIGITGVAPLSDGQKSDGSSHRFARENNPFSYYERTKIIRAALVGDGFDLSRITFTPFPIENPSQLTEFVPKEIHCFTTVREEWNYEKIELLRKLGYQVTVLYSDLKKAISGSAIRHLIRSGDPSWKHLVPSAVVTCLSDEGLRLRLIKSTRQSPPP